MINDYADIINFKFSVIMAIYNTSEYLHDSIGSIINQTLSFEDNIQLILINDGSEDNSLDIILDYQKKFPKNIIVIDQENKGQASARNSGLKHVKSKYVNFLDSDDYISENTLEEVYAFFEEHYHETDIVAIPMTFFGKKEGPHMLNNKFYTSQVIDLSKEHNSPQLSSSSAFFKTAVLKNMEFPTDVLFSEDGILINKLLLDNPFLGVINTAEYFYRKRFDESSTMDSVNKKKEFFVNKLRDYFLYLFEYAESKLGEVPYFLQYTLAYDLQWVFHEDLSLLDDEEKGEFWFYLKKVLKYIDGDVILNNQYIENELNKQFFYSLKKEAFHVECPEETVLVKIGDYVCNDLSNHNIWIDIVELKDNVLNISGFFNSLINSNRLSFEAVKFNEESIVGNYIAKQVKYTSRENISFLSQTFEYKNNFDVSIPIFPKENSIIKLRVNYHIDGNNKNFSNDNLVSLYLKIQFSDHSKLANLSYFKFNDSNFLFVRDSSFYLVPPTLTTMIKKELGNLIHIWMDRNNIEKSRINSYNEIIKLRILNLMLYPFFKLVKKWKQIYLFEDRIDIADDNAFHLFRYANSVNDNVRKYFVLSKDSDQYEKVSKIGKVLIHGSFKHKLIMLHTDKVIATHPYETVINPFWSYEANQRHLVAGLLNYDIYFLQHGVTKDNISSWMSKFDKNLSLILTVSDLEANSFLDEGYNYDKSIIQTLGFPRFDNLERNDNKQILIIPTWRKTIRDNRYLFKNSDYFKNLNSFLNNSNLKKLIELGYEIVFKPHPELTKNIGETNERYLDLFDIPPEITVNTIESYQELFNNSSILITDYSSVFFDFAYLKKPVIYYQPVDDYHYSGSYFDYETMGFGDVIKSEDGLINKLEKYVDNNCQMEEKYQKRVDKFFKYTDKNNCKRVYEWIYNH